MSYPFACTEAIGDRFVFTGELPGKDQVCGTSPLPEDLSVYPVDGNSVHLPRSRSLDKSDRTNPMLRKIFDDVAARSLG